MMHKTAANEVKEVQHHFSSVFGWGNGVCRVSANDGLFMPNGIVLQLYANPVSPWLGSLSGIIDLTTGYDRSMPGRTINAFVADDLK
ncbi:MAG TPA: hypothetical protein VIU12_19005 [Chryseolinea sp.]